MLKPVILACIALIFFGLPVHALNNRTWVSGSGADQDGCGPISNPCRTLQFAHDQTSTHGEINFKDSAGYGGVVITKAINIIADGVLAGVLATNGADAITINAGQSDSVVLRNLTVEGAGTGARGIVYNTGGGLEVSGCTVHGFAYTGASDSGSGIVLRPGIGYQSFVIVGTTVAHNLNAGLHVILQDGSKTSSAIVIDRLLATDNGDGIKMEYRGDISGSWPTIANIRDSVLSRNYFTGIYAGLTKMALSLDNIAADANFHNGMYVLNLPMSVTIGRSSLSNNGQYGVQAGTVATVLSYGDNRINGNGSDPYGGNGSIGKISLQ